MPALNHCRNLFDLCLKPYFLNAYRPLTKGDIFAVKGVTGVTAGHIDFKVIHVDPAPSSIVGPQTTVFWQGRAIARQVHVCPASISNCNWMICSATSRADLLVNRCQCFYTKTWFKTQTFRGIRQNRVRETRLWTGATSIISKRTTSLRSILATGQIQGWKSSSGKTY